MTNTAATITPTNRDLARRFVELTHMHDWIWNDEREELARRLDLGDFRSHDTYLAAHRMAGLS